MHSVSIIVPTLNEAENINELLLRIARVDLLKAYDLEVVVVDDASSDGTCDVVAENQSGLPVRVLGRTENPGLANAIVDGVAVAKGDIIVVMDADLSHPPEAIPDLVASIAGGGYDMAFGSRYVPGGSAPGWSLSRNIASRLAKLLVWPLSDVNDPLSGFFAVHRDRFTRLGKQVPGFKIGLEVLCKSPEPLRTIEIPIEFSDRCRGKSKLSTLVVWEYLRQLMVLAGGNVSIKTGLRFMLVGLFGVVIDVSVFQFLFSRGVTMGVAHISSFAAATVTNFVLNSRWAFSGREKNPVSKGSTPYLSFLFIALLAVFMRGGILAFLTQIYGWPEQAAILAAIFAAAGVNYLGCSFFVFPKIASTLQSSLNLRLAAIGTVCYTLVLRLVYLGIPELMHQEAYYWNYAQHLDIGYLDHPPAVAWIIGLGTMIFGDTEFGVRIGAFACWMVMAFFVYKLTCRMFDKSAALQSLVLVSILPVFFGTGLVMAPDAPLMACWSGLLYFLYRAGIDEQGTAWIGAGICLGLGLLSKYTIVLLVPAAILFCMIDPNSRKWFSRPEPYVGAFIAAVLFSPVIIWNFNNDWISFLFQGPQRVQGSFHFSLHELIGSILILLTPTGLLAAVSILVFKNHNLVDSPLTRAGAKSRRHAFARVFLLVPLSVFLSFSLFRDVKLNWTGPLWISAIPFMAYYMHFAVTSSHFPGQRLFGFVRKIWPATIAVALVCYGAGLHYLTLGLPGLPYPENFSLVGSRDLGRQIEQIENQVEIKTGEEPLVVGMDKYRTASLLAFYRPEDNQEKAASPKKESVAHTVGWHLFGENSLMYQYWFSDQEMNGKRIMILVSPKRNTLADKRILPWVRKMGDIQKIVLHKNGSPVGSYYYVVVNGYKSSGRAVADFSPALVLP